MGVPSQSNSTWLGLSTQALEPGSGGRLKSHLGTPGGDIWQITTLVAAGRVNQANLRLPMGILEGPPLLLATRRPWAADGEIHLGVAWHPPRPGAVLSASRYLGLKASLQACAGRNFLPSFDRTRLSPERLSRWLRVTQPATVERRSEPKYLGRSP